MDWTLANIRERVRQLTGRSTENRLSTSDLDGHINNYYQHHLPDLISPDELQSLFTLNTSAGTGEYGLDARIRAVYPPPFIDGSKASLTHNPGWFFEKYRDRYEQPEGLPETVLYFDRTFWLAPVPDDVYEVQIHALYRPDALTQADDMPVDPRWGEAIAVGAAALIYQQGGDFEQADRMDGFLQYHLRLIGRTNILNWHGKRAVPQF
jgi:hypothetical protein